MKVDSKADLQLNEFMNLQFRPRALRPEIELVISQIIITIAGVAATFYVHARTGDLILTIVTGVFGAAAIFVMEFMWPRPAVVLMINDQGILDRRRAWGLIQWSDILEAHIEWDGKFISLRVKDPDAYIAKLPFEEREKMRFHQSLGFRMLNIEVRGLNMNVLRTVAVIRKKIRQNPKTN